MNSGKLFSLFLLRVLGNLRVPYRTKYFFGTSPSTAKAKHAEVTIKINESMKRGTNFVVEKVSPWPSKQRLD